jgi:carboxylesterase
MIDINEAFDVAAPPGEVYGVLSDPYAVVECVQGAELVKQNEDGSYEGKMVVKFSALRVSFGGRVALDLDEAERRGTVKASGRDGQGGTKFQATAAFQVTPANDGAASHVVATGEVALSGKLASVIENAAAAVVRRMTAEFVEALSRRCASGSTELGTAPAPAAATTPASAPTSPAAATTAATAPTAPAAATAPGSQVSPESSAPAGPADNVAAEPLRSVSVLLLHDFGGSPSNVRPWGESLAAAGIPVSIPRLPGHGTRWQDLSRTGWLDWYTAADTALTDLRGRYDQVFVMGLSIGATVALRLAERRPDDVAGVVAVNPMLSAPIGTPRPLALMRFVRRSSRTASGDVKKSGAHAVGYQRTPLRAALSVERFGATVTAEFTAVKCPVLVVRSAVDHVVRAADANAAATALAQGGVVELADSYHLVPLDNDANRLAEESIGFVTAHRVAENV